MNRTELIEKIAVETNRTKSDVEEVVKSVFDNISGSLAQGEEKVSISGFGTFRANIVPPRKMSSPLNGGGTISVKKTSKVRFNASDKMKEQITKKNKAPKNK